MYRTRILVYNAKEQPVIPTFQQSERIKYKPFPETNYWEETQMATIKRIPGPRKKKKRVHKKIRFKYTLNIYIQRGKTTQKTRKVKFQKTAKFELHKMNVKLSGLKDKNKEGPER